MPNYHISPKTRKVNICKAKVQECPLKTNDGKAVPHFGNKQDAQKFTEQELSKEHEETNSISKKQLIPKPQDITATSYIPNVEKLKEISKYTDYEYDYVDYYDLTVDEESLYIRSIDEDRLTRVITPQVFNKNKDQANLKEIKNMLQKIGALDPENYQLIIEYGYYDEHEITIEPKDHNLLNKLEQEYYKKDNAKDVNGILEYVRSKGQVTEGLSPIEAIKEQLRNENKGRTSSLVEKSNHATARTLKLENVKVSADKHYENVDARDSISENGTQVLDGVVFYDKQSNTYRLIDGYHRLKNLNNKKRRTGKYIVLS